jgi:hypothetical protein
VNPVIIIDRYTVVAFTEDRECFRGDVQDPDDGKVMMESLLKDGAESVIVVKTRILSDYSQRLGAEIILSRSKYNAKKENNSSCRTEAGAEHWH